MTGVATAEVRSVRDRRVGLTRMPKPRHYIEMFKFFGNGA